MKQFNAKKTILGQVKELRRKLLAEKIPQNLANIGTILVSHPKLNLRRVLEYYFLGARVIEVPITLRTVKKPRNLAWGHIIQFFIILKLLCKRY
jgi:hypothetical protein